MRTSVLLAFSVLSLSVAGVAFGQSAPPAQSQMEAPPGEDLSRLHDALRLTPAQEGAWRTYQAAIAPDPTVQARRQQAANMMRTLPTPRRIDLINAEMEADMVAMRRQGDAVKAFYAQLTPAQQRTFDAITYQQQPQNEGGQ